MDVIINWFILIIIFVFDPLAVALVIAFNNAVLVDRGIVDKKNVIRKRELYDEEPEDEVDEDEDIDIDVEVAEVEVEEDEEDEEDDDSDTDIQDFEKTDELDLLKKDASRRGIDIDGDGTIDGYDNNGDGLIDEPRPASSRRAQYAMNERPFYARPNFNWGDRTKWINNQNAVNYWLTYIKNEKDTNYPDNFDSKTY